MDFQDLILGYAIIKNGKITCCSNDLKRLLEDKGTFWTDYDKKEFPLWVE